MMRRVALYMSTKAPTSWQRHYCASILRNFPSTSSPMVKENIFSQSEFDDMIRKTEEMEKSLKKLTQIQNKKMVACNANAGIKWWENEDINKVFEQSEAEKTILKAQISSMKTMLAQIRKHKVFAVDSPDGLPDGDEIEILLEVNRMVENSHLNQTVVTDSLGIAENATKHDAFAVDAPDGEPDGSRTEIVGEVNRLIK